MSMTYDEILQAMLNLVPSNVDKREGSIIYDAIAPCAYFLAQMYFELENFIDLVMPDTAIGEYLDRVVASYGLTRKAASASVREMIASAAVETGTRWAIGDLVYVVTDHLSGNRYEVTCERAGEIGNQYSGALDPISNVTGITAELGEIITAGTDEETDEALRERFFAKVQMPATSGNAYQYHQWALETSGCGAAKVLPLDDGPGTVAVLVVDDDYEISETLPTAVSGYIETVRPIGATVTVESPGELSVSVTANVALDGSASLSKVTEAFQASLESFLKATIFQNYKLSYAKISSLLLDIPGVEDYDEFLLNDAAANVTVGDKQIPVVGNVKLTEVSALAVDAITS